MKITSIISNLVLLCSLIGFQVQQALAEQSFVVYYEHGQDQCDVKQSARLQRHIRKALAKAAIYEENPEGADELLEMSQSNGLTSFSDGQQEDPDEIASQLEALEEESEDEWRPGNGNGNKNGNRNGRQLELNSSSENSERELSSYCCVDGCYTWLWWCCDYCWCDRRGRRSLSAEEIAHHIGEIRDYMIEEVQEDNEKGKITCLDAGDVKVEIKLD